MWYAASCEWSISCLRSHIKYDVVITWDNISNVSDINAINPVICDGTENVSNDHFAVKFETCAEKPVLFRKTYLSENWDTGISMQFFFNKYFKFTT